MYEHFSLSVSFINLQCQKKRRVENKELVPNIVVYCQMLMFAINVVIFVVLAVANIQIHKQQQQKT